MANSWEKANALLHEYDNLQSTIRMLDQEIPYRLVLLVVTVAAAMITVSVQAVRPSITPPAVFGVLMLFFLAIALTVAYMRLQACTSYHRLRDIERHVNSLLEADLLRMESWVKPTFNKRTQKGSLGIRVWYYLFWGGLALAGYITSAYGLSRSVPAWLRVPAWLGSGTALVICLVVLLRVTLVIYREGNF